MEELTNLSYTSILRYFKTLSTFGYKSYSEVDRLIMLLYIEEFLFNMYMFVSEEDYKEILKGLNCLYGSTCLIDFPNYNVYDSIMRDAFTHTIKMKISEDSIFRVSQNNILRIKT